MYAEVRRLLTEEAVGELNLVKAYFGSPQLHIHPPGEEGAGRRRAARHRRVLPAVCPDGVRRGKTGVHSGHGGAAGLRWDSAQVPYAELNH